MDANVNPIELCGTVAAVIYQNEENGYTVLKLDVDDGSQTMVVGCIPYAVPGESMIVSGSWMTHPAHGQQFKADFAERTMPETADAIYAYLAGRAVRGIGPATASLMVSRFGADTLNVLEYEPEKLCTIKGISLSKAKAMSANFRRQAGMRRLIEFLASANIRPVIALRMYQYYGDDALQLVQDNPYILVSDAIGASFQEADALALGHGFDDQSAERVAAATLYELAYNAVRGHCFISYRNLLAATSQLSGVPDELVAESVDALVQSGALVRERVAGCDGCYLARLHEAEAYTAERLLAMTQTEYRRMPDTDKIAARIEAQLGLTFADQQKETLRLACQHQVIAITGGPGTGKTTTVNAILSLYEALYDRVALCAPTGRAAKRLSELTNHAASTIHRLLEVDYSSGSVRFIHNEKNLLKYDVIILDEMSMVDVKLFQALLAAARYHCRIIMVGDADQLPSVGPGNILGEILKAGVVPTVRLTDIFRQAQRSLIVQNAHRIVEGQMPQKGGPKDDFFLIESNGLACQKLVCDLVSTRLPKAYGFDPVRDIQVLCPTKVGPTGSVELNRRLQDILNPPAKGKGQIGTAESAKILRLGDKVMQVKNDYDITFERAGAEAGVGAYNGDLGIITAVDVDARSVTVQMDDKKYTYTADQLNELEPAYAVTVHKSQGSEFPAVILPVADVPARLCYRNLLYTGVTRARKLCVLTGTARTEQTMVENVRQNMRYSGLRYLLKDAATPTEEKQEQLSAT